MEKDKIKTQKHLIDSRPFIKTAIQLDKQTFLIIRKNQLTGEMFSFKIKAETYLTWRQTRNEAFLQELTEIERNFLIKNVIPGENKNNLLTKKIVKQLES